MKWNLALISTIRLQNISLPRGTSLTPSLSMLTKSPKAFTLQFYPEEFMKIDFAHIRERSTAGDWIDFAVFGARSTSCTATANADVLARPYIEGPFKRLLGRPISLSVR